MQLPMLNRWSALLIAMLAVCAQAQPVATTTPAASPTLTASPAFPATERIDVTDTYFGQRIVDPYRWLEELDAPKVQAWMKAADAHARAQLAALPQRDALLARIQTLESSASTRIGKVQQIVLPGAKQPTRYVYERRRVQDNQFAVVMRDGLDGAETVLVDPAALSLARGGKPIAINHFAMSPDGHYLAYAISESGSEAASLYVQEVATGRLVGEPITRADFALAQWAPDSRAFAFTRLADHGADKLRKYDDAGAWLAVIEPSAGSNIGGPQAGGPQASGSKAARPQTTAPTLRIVRELLGPSSQQPGHPLSLKPSESPTVSFSDDGRWLIGTLEDGDRREIRVVVAPAPSARRLRDPQAPPPAWTDRIRYEDQVVAMVHGAGQLFARTYRDAPTFRILGAPIGQFDARSAPTVVLPSERVIGQMAVARDALYFDARDSNPKQLWRLPHPDQPDGRQAAQANARLTARPPAQQVPLPLAGTFQLARGGIPSTHPQRDGALINLEHWTHAPQLYQVQAAPTSAPRGNPPAMQVVNTGLQPTGPFDRADNLIATDVLVTSHDGARVPMSILHRKDVPLDGKNPTLLIGYAAYGFTWEPRFDLHRLAFLERGGIVAMANPRGSGVFGQAWYEAGKQATKPNTWRDMIACAEYLVAHKYASPATLAISGGSAGGITSGRAATERPDLFAAVVPRVGVLDALRFELEPNGPPNIPEFGTHTTEPGFKALLAMSTYHHIRPGVRYPAVLLTHGVHDPRVTVWHSNKAAAAFEAARMSVPDGRPVLLRLDYEGGHGVGNTKAQAQRESADIFAFLLWQLGGAHRP